MSQIFKQLNSKACLIKAGVRQFSSNGTAFHLKRFALADSTPSFPLCKTQTRSLGNGTLLYYDSATLTVVNNRHFSSSGKKSRSHTDLGKQLERITDKRRIWLTPPTVTASCNYLKPLLQIEEPVVCQQLRLIRTHQPRKLSDLAATKGTNSQSKRADTKPTLEKQNGKPESAGDSSDGNPNKAATETTGTETLTLYQRFKKTYKEHGKVLVAVHLATSAVWFGSFYTAARLGIDIVPWLESWGLSERMISPFRHGGLGDVALAYLMYKLATPARYTVTIGGTNLAIRYLRKEGKMEPIRKEDKLRSLYKEGKEEFKERSRRRISRIRRRRHRNKHKQSR